MWHIHDGGSQMKSDRFLIKAAELYYRDGLSQQEIAKKLHTSRTSISRALIQARNEGYVQIRIQYPEQSDLALERKLEEKYGDILNIYYVSGNSIEIISKNTNKSKAIKLLSKKLEINFKTDILKITKAGKGGIENESES